MRIHTFFKKYSTFINCKPYLKLVHEYFDQFTMLKNEQQDSFKTF